LSRTENDNTSRVYADSRICARAGAGHLAGRSMRRIFTEDRHLTGLSTRRRPVSVRPIRLNHYPARPAIPKFHPARTSNETPIDRHVAPIVHHLQVFHMQNRSAWDVLLFSIDRMTLRPTIISAASRRWPPPVDRTTICPPRMTLIAIGHGKYFTQLVRDKDDRFACSDQLAHD